MEIAETIQSIRNIVKIARDDGKTIGFVPTMGALHFGHISLIEAAIKKCDFVAVSIFVNPTQFAPGEDLDKYPKPIEEDMEICKKAGVNAVFTPTTDIMYGKDNLTWVNVEKLTDQLCGKSRPEHFRGVTTVCAKLFNIVMPDIAFFGQKDAQQAIVIKKMVTDLNMPLEITLCPIIREPSGLAISSRNKYLNEQETADSVYIYKSLQKSREMIENGISESGQIVTAMGQIMAIPGSIEVEYLSILDAETLEVKDKISGKILAAVAVKIGQTRLIDNIIVDCDRF